MTPPLRLQVQQPEIFLNTVDPIDVRMVTERQAGTVPGGHLNLFV